MTQTASPPPAQVRRQIESWLAANRPATLQLLRRHPAGDQALEEAAAAVIRNLTRAATVQADPATADPAQGDSFYLMPHPDGLQAALIRLLASDPDYWDGKLRFLPLLTPETPAG
jgi:hypothetical protein